jgi:hypothetical protein
VSIDCKFEAMLGFIVPDLGHVEFALTMTSGSFDVDGTVRALRDRPASRPVAPVKTRDRRLIIELLNSGCTRPL